MKNKFKKGVSVLVGMALMLSIAASCESKDPVESPTGGESGPEDASDAVETDSSPKEVDNDRDPEVVARAAEIAQELEGDPSLPDIEVKDKLTLLSWYGIDETSPTAELYRARYRDDDVFDFENTSYETRYSRLSTLIMSGDSPDIFPFEERYFPYGVYVDQYSPIDDVIDISGPEWEPTRDIIELFKWGGHNYTAITELNNSSALLFYRRSVVQNAGLKDDPYDLWKQNNWTWDTFKTMVKDFSVPDQKWGIVGTYIDEAAILSTGVGIISLEDGMLKSNMEDGRIERAMNFLQELAVNDFRYPYHTLSNFQIGPGPFRAGNVLFWNDGPWKYQETLQPISKAEQWDDDEIGIVPFPQDPQADKYYHRGKQDAFMLVSGAKNKEGFRAWAQCGIIANYDPKMKELGREKAKHDYGWTDKHLDVLEEIRKLSLVWDFKNGIGPDIADPVVDSEVENLSKPVITLGESYTQMRGENSGPILARIKEMNATVGG